MGNMDVTAKEKGKMKVYIVMHGSYDDTYVGAVFTDRTKAGEYMTHYQGSLEEWETDVPYRTLPPGMGIFYIHMKRNGDIAICRHIFPRDPSDLSKLDMLARVAVLSSVTSWHGPNVRVSSSVSNPLLIGYFLARDEKHAIEVANEKRVQLIAGGAWND
jgi:hypothetical protein